MSFAVGTMVMLTIGPFLSYLTLNIINTVIVFVLTVPVLFLPETPYFLYSKGELYQLIAIYLLEFKSVSALGKLLAAD